jgi:fructose-bisphosphate aldolase class 1
LVILLVKVKKGTREMKNFDIEVFVKDLDKLFNDMQDKAIAGSENVATASWVIKQQAKEIEYWKEMFEKAMETQDK